MIWPAIDLMNGACVRLHKGDFDQKSTYDADPLARAQAFAAADARCLHVVDLDGARKQVPQQSELIIRLASETGLRVQAGGGIRTGEHINRLLKGSVARVIIGSLAVTDPERVLGWLNEFGAGHMVLALDIRMQDGVPIPAIKGWQEATNTNLWDVLDKFEGAARHVLVTDIDRDGVLQGANSDLYQKIRQRHPGFSLLASGGIGSIDDIHAVREADTQGVIIGKALYENKFSLTEALACWPDG